jgi:GNAT superfamily N-acetyltransferase
MADKASYRIIIFEGNSLPKQYLNLVTSKWMRNFRYGNDYIKLIDADNYFANYSQYIRLVLNLPETIVALATLTDDEDVVLGFSVISGKTLQYVHVHKDMRRQGIGKQLIPAYIDSFTHITRIGMKLWPTKMPNAKFIIYSGAKE